MSEDEFELTFRSNGEFELKSMEGKVTRYSRIQLYTPTAAEAQPLAGRYENDEIGAFFDMSADKDGLMGQANNAPDGVLSTSGRAYTRFGFVFGRDREFEKMRD